MSVAIVLCVQLMWHDVVRYQYQTCMFRLNTVTVISVFLNHLKLLLRLTPLNRIAFFTYKFSHGFLCKAHNLQSFYFCTKPLTAFFPFVSLTCFVPLILYLMTHFFKSFYYGFIKSSQLKTSI